MKIKFSFYASAIFKKNHPAQTRVFGRDTIET